MMIKDSKKHKFKKGFSIGEVLVSVFIIVVGIVAVVGLIANSIKHSADSRNQLIAGQLAQEGVELVRNIKDNNLAAGGGEFDNLPASSTADCRVDMNSANIAGSTGCGVVVSKDLNYSAGNFYVHSAGSATRFKRKINLTYDTGSSASANNLTVESIVTWGSSFSAVCNVGSKCADVREILTKQK